MSNQPAKTEKTAGASLRTTVLLNLVFLLLAALIVRVGYESNDDLTLAAFVDGQMAQSTAYIPYLNIVLGWLLKLIYDVLGRQTAWHTFCQYALLFAGFSSLSFVLCERLGALHGALVGAVLLVTVGTDVYCIINYTKTAAVCTVGGMALLVHASEREGKHPIALVFGVLLSLVGFMLRSMEFLPCFAIMAALCLPPLWELLARKNGAGIVRLAAPFALVLALSAGLWAFNEWAWSKQPWSIYHDFDKIRVAYSDYGRPVYQDMPEVYDALGLSETDTAFLFNGDYFDPEAFSGSVMQSITEAREKRFPPPSPGECLGQLLDRAIPGFFAELPVYGLVLVLVLWLAAAEHDLKNLACIGCAAAVFILAYLYLIYRGRYLIDRVDAGLLLAAAAVPALSLKREKLRRERMLCLLIPLLALGITHYRTRGDYRSASTEDRSAERAAYETLLRDTEHIYLMKLDAAADGLWSPFEASPQGYWDRIVLLGGFDCLHPTIMGNLAIYGISNPYRDCIDNDKARLIDGDIELTLAYLHEHYDSRARAVPVEPLSSETGLPIYRITSR